MNDELTHIWQEQGTAGMTISVEELRARAHRLQAGLKRRHRVQVSTLFLLLLIACLNLLFWGNPITAWFRAAQFVLYVIVFIYMAVPWAKKAPATEGRILTLNMLAVATPCVEFYRNELETRRETLRHSRRLAPVLMVIGASFALFGTQSSRNQLPVAVGGSAAMIVALVWYLKARREFPRVQAELADLEATAPQPDQPKGNFR
jgi:hypothetical protein